VGKSTATSPQAEIYVNKLEAARRQIDAAIRMLLATEDCLAIHTVASAGYRIIRDLLEHRGVARDIANGAMTREQLTEFEDDNLKDFILYLADRIKDGVTLDETDLTVRLDETLRRDEWQNVAVEPVAKLFGTPRITPLESRQCI